MRKAWYILLACLILSLIGFSAAHFVINESGEAVTWQEETVFGDKSAVEGIQIRTVNHMSQNLLWETEGTLGSALNPETKFTFSNNSIYLGSETEYTGLDIAANLEFLASLAFGSHETMYDYAKEKYADLIVF